ncbi:hypothetical protein HYFRA_00006481 [Hymenoscyphus fraxineus]|uniref:Cytochrome P450 n=1 Tax=Hymenoscyphus fraxineus TaxID=746836 RepID=A0A9N9PPZ9_9HELO|nr:hypothetical protein HYFRA_00006481 [Hymenoscyphus fraxineus]
MSTPFSVPLFNGIDLAYSPGSKGVIQRLLSFASRTTLLGLLLALALYYLSSSLKNKESAQLLNRIPGPWYAPFTGLHLRWMFGTGTIWKYASEQHQRHGDIIRLGPRQLWVSDKAAMKDILLKTDLPKVTMYAEISRDRRSPGLFGEIRPEPHKNLKRFLGPAFTVSSVDTLDLFFKDCVQKLLRNYYAIVDSESTPKAAFETDLMRDLHCLALDIMGESAFGKGFGQVDQVFDATKIRTQREKEWFKIPDAIFSGLAKRYKSVFVKRFFRRLGLDIEFDWPKAMTRAISTLIDERRTNERDPNARRDVLQHMLEEGKRPDTGIRMSNQDIIDQMSELLLAGSETTSGTIAFLFLELARNPDVRAKLLASLPVLSASDPILDSKTVREQPTYRYLEACIKENLRIHPIASEMGRRTMKESFQVQGYVIPPHTVVSASYRMLHLDERYWPEPERFWPERWLQGDEREGAPEPDMDAYYPFSAGKHSCIGMNFAMAEIRTASANILSRFDVEEPYYQEIDVRQFITMQFSDGSWKVSSERNDP